MCFLVIMQAASVIVWAVEDDATDFSPLYTDFSGGNLDL